MLKIMNPADGSLVRELAEEADVAGRYESARAAQPAWAAVPLTDKLEMIQRFKTLVARRTQELAQTLTREMGKPIRQATTSSSRMPKPRWLPRKSLPINP
jgi:acyl-CoA reductase-like NAD-dependent aldehyde dehydrogenase